MKRDLWNHGFPKLPKWTCPTCESGLLVEIEGSLYEAETDESINDREKHPDWDPDWRREKFVALLKCDICGEIVTVAGSMPVWMHEDYAKDEQYWQTYYLVRHMHPAPHIIEVSKDLPEQCADQLKVAFELYWVDKAAAANRLRILVERLMDHFEVPVQGKGNKTKRHILDLSERIDEFEKMKPGHKDVLDALRYVGNRASHVGESDREALLDCFELLESALSELIDDKKAKLAAKAKALVQNKGNPKPWA